MSAVPVTAGQGRQAGPGRDRTIKMVNTHETVVSTGFDNSHDVGEESVKRESRHTTSQAGKRVQLS